ncbi:Stf0 family sulfotransferase [Paracoccus sulfuroxidans]|uniref:LPS sulfotransferase NodH n=1 Tax=Paracoccus sulfuroxidans TaxID=384678 RepID=A0A562NS89_9RHOB|nr:Stf0 family sulfotransferase [Paracoccus sulfuroxidans]TWI34921.1 LPS sulfotransferase NodH [Paracoccus sulfuroxidans]
MTTKILGGVASAPMVHETNIEGIFSGRVRFEEAAPVFNHPLYLIGFTNRCGSNLLAGYLRSTPAFDGFYEQLNHDTVGARLPKLHAETFPDYLRAISQNHPGNGKMIGFKASWDQLRMLLRWRIDRMYEGGIRMIHISRENLIEQAVSWSIAFQTKQWTSQENALAAAVYDESDIDLRLSYIMQSNQNMGYLLALSGIPSLPVRYSDICRDPAAVVRSIGAFADVDLQTWEPGASEIRKQGGDMNKEFVARYIREKSHAIGFAPHQTTILSSPMSVL